MRILTLATVFLSAIACAGNGRSAADAPIRVLVITATQGFRHTEAIEASKARLNQGAAPDMRFEFTEDPGALTADNLAQYDVLFINNATLRIAPNSPRDSAEVKWPRTGVAKPVTRDQQQAIASFVRGGKGLVVTHSGVDAFYGWPEYREMVGGGLFTSHPFTREAKVNVEDQRNPAMTHFGPSVNFREEYYYLDRNPRSSSHVLMSLDLPSVGDTTRTDHPLALVRRYGQGRVYVNVLGHFGDTWKRDDYLTSILQGIRIAAGRLQADFSAPAH